MSNITFTEEQFKELLEKTPDLENKLKKCLKVSLVKTW